jgi:purine catabolism regulator
LRGGLSRQQRGTAAAREAVRQSSEALVRGGRDAITRYEDVELESLLHSLHGADSFVEVRLGPLLDGSPASVELLLTLQTYLATGRNAKEAASRLAVHRNTLIYRLRRLQDLLDIQWDDADGVFAIDLALRLLRTTLSPYGDTDSRSR